MKHNTFIFYSKKLLLFILSIIALSFIVFVMSRLSPGDPLVSYYGDRVERMSASEKEQTMERLGLNEPIIMQYGIWAGRALQGDFGISYKYKEDVLQVLADKLGNTIWLGGVSFLCIFLLAILLGGICALRENSILDKLICKIGVVSSSIPTFYIALLLIFIFSAQLGVLPSSGAFAIGQSDNLQSRIIHSILPVSAIVIPHVWYYAYSIRNKLLQEIRKEYALFALSKGLSSSKVMWSHCLKNSWPTFISLMVISIPHIIGGTYIVEMIFSYPGLGTLSFESAKYHDYNLLMVITLFTGMCVIFFNAIGKITMEKIDPRIKQIEVYDR